MEQDAKIKTMQTLEKWRDMFLKEQKIKKRSKRTIELSKIEIDKFFEFLRENDDFCCFEDFEHSLIKMYLFDLSEKFEKKNKRDISPQTLNLAISRIKTFFHYITENNDDLLDFSKVFAKIKTTPTRAEIPRFTEEDNKKIVSFLRNISPLCISESKRKTMFAITILYYAGLRSAEILSLCPKDFSLEVSKDNESFYVMTFVGKGGKKREVPISQNVLLPYEDYIKSPKKEEKIFSVTYRGLLFSIRKSLAEIGVENFSGNHAFRHNLATMLVEKNVNMQVVSSILGHSSISTTEKFYSRVGMGSKIDALKWQAL